jgi:hypothetical protein
MPRDKDAKQIAYFCSCGYMEVYPPGRHIIKKPICPHCGTHLVKVSPKNASLAEVEARLALRIN